MSETSVSDAEIRVGSWIRALKAAANDKHAADAIADQQSIDRAADFEEIYQAMAWVADVPVPKRKRGRRGVDPKSRAQFAKWVRQQYEWGSQSRLDQLEGARLFTTTNSLVVKSERSLRPLWKLRDQGYADHLLEVWRAAEHEPGQPPTSTAVSRAVNEFIERHRAPVKNLAADDRTLSEIRNARRARLIAEFDALLEEENTTAKTALNEMIQHFNKHQQDLKAAS